MKKKPSRVGVLMMPWLGQRRQTYLEGRAKISPAPDVHPRETRPVKPGSGATSDTARSQIMS